ncbi:hypothetical protein [Singulisphaera sp. PoT]|uniref:hypothetical protein n=1 Tax=Singulisphaera sp. PoT TaxID=3411797 RepID=UPI003BF4E849
MTRNELDLDVRTFFFQMLAINFFLAQLLIWLHFPHHGQLGQRILLALFTIPMAMFPALLTAGLMTLAAALLVRILIRPLVDRWLRPVVDDAQGAFHLAPSEWVIEASPARWKKGWLWIPGLLVRTNQKVWFFPRAFEVEAWSCLLVSPRDVELEPGLKAAWGYIKNWPDRVVVRVADDSPAVFAVPEPHSVSQWLKPSQAKVAHAVRS